MGEVLFVISLISGLIFPFLFLTGKGRWFWTITMSIVGIVIALSEIISKTTTGHTISQHFWIWSLAHPQTAILVLVMLGLGWLSLLIHLGWKLIKKWLSKER